jgi:hypothetical protein
MSEWIPEDVWTVTNALVPGNVVAYTAEHRTRYRVLVARAILAERERCAAIADRAYEAGHWSRETDHLWTYSQDVGAAIRGTPTAPIPEERGTEEI